MSFAENTVYNLLEPDMNKLTLDLMVPMTYSIPTLNPTADISEIESDEWKSDFLADPRPDQIAEK